jgi:glycosyltransferase involved in cell wall biosynthesis
MIEEKVDRFKVSWLGNVIPRKRPNDFVNVIIKLQNLLPVQAQLIGSLNDTESLGQDFMSLARNPPEFISFLGELPRPHALYIVKNSDIYCHTSSDESFALAPLEAAALGVPVILADLPVYQFIGWRHQENCLLYPPGDDGSLAKCIRELHDNAQLRTLLAKRGNALVNLYSGEIFLNKITALMQSFAPSDPPS